MAQPGISVKSLVSSFETRVVGKALGPPRKRGCVSSPSSPRGASPIRGAPGPTPLRGLGGPGQRPSPRRGMDKTLLPLILCCHSGSGSLVGIDNKIEQAMVLFWRHRAKASMLEHSGFKKVAVKGVEKTSKELETVKLVELPREEKLPGVEECSEMPEVPEAFVLASTVEEAELKVGHRRGLSLLRLSRSAVQSVSTLMLSALQSGWQLCKWKSSVSSASVTSQLRTQSPLENPEAEMLREVYLVLWAIRKQLRQLARRQERRRRHHIRSHFSAQPDPVKGLRQDARSPL